MVTKPIFLFALPRSGSTLLQRLLAGHPDIMTVSEPWLLLPFCYAVKPEGLFSEYNHGWATKALNEFILGLPNQELDYYKILKKFALALYDRANENNALYFLDKTPRYYLIIPQIVEIFPEAKFIFLFRNPIQVLSSIIESLNNNSLCLHEYRIDLYRGPHLLAEGYRKNFKNSISVNFENLIRQPEIELQRITSYLTIDYTDTMLSAFPSVQLNGTMGDKQGYSKYSKIEKKVHEKWRSILGTKLRKKYARKYISTYSSETLQTFGYDHSELLLSINDLRESRSRIIRDSIDILVANLYSFSELPMFIKKFRTSKISDTPWIGHR